MTYLKMFDAVIRNQDDLARGNPGEPQDLGARLGALAGEVHGGERRHVDHVLQNEGMNKTLLPQKTSPLQALTIDPGARCTARAVLSRDSFSPTTAPRFPILQRKKVGKKKRKGFHSW